MKNSIEPYGYIYLTTNKINGKRYIGQHSRSKLDKRYLGGGTALNKDIREYGRQNFKIQILQYSYIDTGFNITPNHPKISKSQSILNFLETYWIEKLKTHISKGGYNLQTGGGQFGRHSIEMRKANSERQLNWSPEFKAAKIAKALETIANKSEEERKITQQKMSEARKRRITKPETIQKTKQTLKNRSRDEWDAIKRRELETKQSWSKERKEEYSNSLSIGVRKAFTEKDICIHCGKEVSKKLINRDHNDRCRHNPNREWFHCPVCEKKFTSSNYLLTHINRYHYELVESGAYDHKDVETKEQLLKKARKAHQTNKNRSKESKKETQLKRQLTKKINQPIR